MRAFLFLPGLLAAVPAQAQPKLLQAHAAAASGYTGPGDVVGSAVVWYGLRGYSAAYAAPGTGNSVNVRRASDNATQDIVILTTGAVDIASYNTFVGTDATASCTVAGTSAACTGASATIHVGDPVTGTGLTNPCVVTATNGSTTATISLAGTTTSCGTVAVAATFTFQVAGFLPTIYDQSSNTRNCIQATSGTQPQLFPLGGGTGGLLPTILYKSTNCTTSATVTVSQPNTWQTMAQRASNFTTSQTMVGSSTKQVLQYKSSTNAISVFAGSSTTATASDSAYHALMAIVNGASSTLNVDDTPGTVSAGANALSTNTISICTDGFGTSNCNAVLQGEQALWASGLNSTQQTNICHNVRLYWGTPGSC